jgi:hypothetical protein
MSLNCLISSRGISPERSPVAERFRLYPTIRSAGADFFLGAAGLRFFRYFTGTGFGRRAQY